MIIANGQGEIAVRQDGDTLKLYCHRHPLPYGTEVEITPKELQEISAYFQTLVTEFCATGRIVEAR
jgi:hypothetical protein